VAPSVSDRIKSGSQRPSPPIPGSAYPGENTMPVPYDRQSSDFYKTVQRVYDQNQSYNPLHGVPFAINPDFVDQSENFNNINTDVIDKYASISDLLTKYNVDFSLEKSCLAPF